MFVLLVDDQVMLCLPCISFLSSKFLLEAAKNYQREKKVFPDFNDIGLHIFTLATDAKAIKFFRLFQVLSTLSLFASIND